MIGFTTIVHSSKVKRNNINVDIKTFVKKGVQIQVQQALDIIRVTANHAVHPRKVNFEDPPQNLITLLG